MKIQKIKNFGKKFFASIVLAIFTMGIFIPYASAHTLTNMFSVDSGKQYNNYGEYKFEVRWIQNGFGQTYFNENYGTYVLLNSLFQFKAEEFEQGHPVEFLSVGKTGYIIGGVNAQKIFADGDYPINDGLEGTVGFFVYIEGDIYFFPSDSTFEKSKKQQLNLAYKIWDKSNRIVGDGLFIFITMRYDFSVVSPGRSVMQIFASGDYSNTYITKIEEHLLPSVFKSTFPGTFPEEEKGLMPFILKPSNKIYYEGISDHDIKPYYSAFTPILFPDKGWNHYTQYSMIPAFWYWQNKDNYMDDNSLNKNYLTAVPITFLFNGYKMITQTNWGFGIDIEEFGKDENVNFLRWYRMLYRPDDFYNIEKSPVTTGIINYFSNGKYTYSDHSTIGNKPEDGDYTGPDNPAIQKCGGITDIGCHVSNLTKGIGNFIVNIWSGFSDIIKGIFTWLWEGIKTFLFSDTIKGIFTWLWEGIQKFLSPISTPILDFLKPLYTDIVQPVWQFFWSFFDPLWKVATGKTDVHSFLHGDQNRICALQTGYYVEHNAKWNEKPAEFFQMLFFLANPKLPADNSQICTSLGMKQIQYGKNTLLDTTLFLIFFATGIWFSLFIIRPQ